MNYDKKLKITHSKSKVQWWAFFAILGIVLTFTACSDDDDSIYPSLKLVNETTQNKPITSVKLVGYEFTNLNIEAGSSQTFTLDKGMQGGYSDIYVTVGYKRYPTVLGSASITVDFHNGETTTITLKGCSGSEGCPGIYLE